MKAFVKRVAGNVGYVSREVDAEKPDAVGKGSRSNVGDCIGERDDIQIGLCVESPLADLSDGKAIDGGGNGYRTASAVVTRDGYRPVIGGSVELTNRGRGADQNPRGCDHCCETLPGVVHMFPSVSPEDADANSITRERTARRSGNNEMECGRPIISMYGVLPCCLPASG